MIPLNVLAGFDQLGEARYFDPKRWCAREHLLERIAAKNVDYGIALDIPLSDDDFFGTAKIARVPRPHRLGKACSLQRIRCFILHLFAAIFPRPREMPPRLWASSSHRDHQQSAFGESAVWRAGRATDVEVWMVADPFRALDLCGNGATDQPRILLQREPQIATARTLDNGTDR